MPSISSAVSVICNPESNNCVTSSSHAWSINCDIENSPTAVPVIVNEPVVVGGEPPPLVLTAENEIV